MAEAGHNRGPVTHPITFDGLAMLCFGLQLSIRLTRRDVVDDLPLPVSLSVVVVGRHV